MSVPDIPTPNQVNHCSHVDVQFVLRTIAERVSVGEFDLPLHYIPREALFDKVNEELAWSGWKMDVEGNKAILTPFGSSLHNTTGVPTPEEVDYYNDGRLNSLVTSAINAIQSGVFQMEILPEFRPLLPRLKKMLGRKHWLLCELDFEGYGEYQYSIDSKPITANL
jgi:hypothetical protein